MVRARVVPHPCDWTHSAYRGDSESTKALWNHRPTSALWAIGWAIGNRGKVLQSHMRVAMQDAIPLIPARARQSDRHVVAPIPHIHTDPKLYWFFV
jgi:hypothetical protein